MQLVAIRSPKTHQVHKVLPSRVVARLSEGWQLVDKEQQQYYSSQVSRLRTAMVTHSNPSA